MNNNSNEKHISNSGHRLPISIEVEGLLAESWSDRLADMRITTRKRTDQTTVKTLDGRLRDQAELSGVLKSLYDLHRPIFESGSCDRRIAAFSNSETLNSGAGLEHTQNEIVTITITSQL